MFAFYATKGISLLDKLNELYQKYGYRLNSLRSYAFEGSSGFEKMRQIMDRLRKGIEQVGEYKVERVIDYSLGIDELPRSNVIMLILNNGCTIVIRPSGTEPKLKIYISVKSNKKESLKSTDRALFDSMKKQLVFE